MRRTWNGKLPEEFNEKDMLLFAIDTDLTLNGRVSADTLDAVRKAGYSYEKFPHLRRCGAANIMVLPVAALAAGHGNEFSRDGNPGEL